MSDVDKRLVILSAVAAASLMASGAVARQAVTISDGSFQSDWFLTKFDTGTDSMIQATWDQIEGNPVTSMKITNFVGPSHDLQGFHKYGKAGVRIDPSLGGIRSLSFSIQAKKFSGGNATGQQIGPAIEQAGVAYRAGSLTTGNSTNWVTRKGTFVAADFTRFDGQPGNPDFSISGSPITVGFRSGNSGSADLTVTFNYDNFSMTAFFANLTISDGTFNDSDWVVTNFITGSGGTATGTQTTGGNPADCRQVLNHMNGGSASLDAFHKYNAPGAEIDPSLAPVASVDLVIDAKFVSGPGNNGERFGLALEQGGIAYKAGSLATGRVTDWTTYSTLRMKSGDFTRFDGQPGTPDFSKSGDPIRFGYFTANTNGAGSGAINLKANYDNFAVHVHFVDCPCDLTSDGVVDDSDFIVFAGAYNILDCADPAMPLGCPSDLDKDGLVDDGDFVEFLLAYNTLECP
ncbi:MAG: hypothetical protein JSS51_05265 [Planctomycetes bacterium]|nr:hypothetical protein [Planctomycetota bacterium]